MTLWQRFKFPPLLAIILLLTAGLYVQVWHHTLVWDEHALTNQRVVIHPSWANYLRSAQETYRPLALLSAVVDRLIWRGWPPGYAIDGLLYHLAVVVLFFYLIRGWVALFPAAVSTMIVALHPIGAETVHYLLGRPDLLSAGSLLASLLAFQRLDHTERWPVTLALFWGFGLLALAAKETALLLPCLALVLCFTQMESLDRKSGGKKPSRLRRRMLALAPFVLLAGLYISARVWGWMTIGTPIHLHLGVEQLAVMGATTAGALNILFLPVDLCPWYEGRIAMPSSTWLAAGALLIGLAGVLYLIWRFRHRAPAVSVGLAWLTGILALIVIRAAADPTPMNPLAVRWLYPAVIGAALGIGGLLHWIEPLWPRFSRVAAVCGVLLLTGLTWQSQSFWQNDLSALGRAFHCAPHSPLITLQYADLLQDDGQSMKANQLMTQLIKDYPSHPSVLSRQIQNEILQGDYEQALIYAKQLSTVAPSPLAFRRLANLEVATGRADAATKHYLAALASSPDNILVTTALGSLYEQRRQLDEAESLYAQGLMLHPEAANLWFRYGRVYETSGRLPEAFSAYEEVMRLDRFCPDGFLAAARIMDQMGKHTVATSILRHYEKSTQQQAIPRPTMDSYDSPCGMEIKSGGMISGSRTSSGHP